MPPNPVFVVCFAFKLSSLSFHSITVFPHNRQRILERFQFPTRYPFPSHGQTKSWFLSLTPVLVRERWRGLLRLPGAAPAAVGAATGAVWPAAGHHVEAAAAPRHRVAPVGRAVGRRTAGVRLPFVRVRLPCLGKKRLFYKGAEWRRGLVSDKMGQGSFMKETTCGVKGAIFDVKQKQGTHSGH